MKLQLLQYKTIPIVETKKEKKPPTEKQLLALEKARKTKANKKIEELNTALSKPSKKSKVKVVQESSESSEEENPQNDNDTVLYYQPHDSEYIKKLDDVSKMLSYLVTQKEEKILKKETKKKQSQPQKNLTVEHHKSQINKTPMSSFMFD